MSLPSSRGVEEGCVWTVPGADGFRWRDYDTISVLFDPRSGEMHLLDPLSREVLEQLSERPMTGDQTSRALSAMMESTAPEDVSAKVDEILTQFDRIGLIFPATAESA